MDDVLTSTSSKVPPIVIEVENCACRKVTETSSSSSFSEENPLKRLRTSRGTACDCSSLNLLVKAMERVSRVAAASSSAVKIVDRVPSMCHEIAVAKSRSADASLEADNGPSPVPVKSIVYYKRPSGSRLPPPPLYPAVLPKGRPLMAPPRLPTNLRPGQIMLRNTNQVSKH